MSARCQNCGARDQVGSCSYCGAKAPEPSAQRSALSDLVQLARGALSANEQRAIAGLGPLPRPVANPDHDSEIEK